MKLPLTYTFALIGFLHSVFISESYEEKIKRQIGSSNIKKVEIKNLRVYAFNSDSVAVIPVKGKDIREAFLFYDINEKECFWIEIYPGKKEHNSQKAPVIHISSANYIYKKILYLDAHQRMVLKQETYRNNHLNSTAHFFDSSSKKIFDFAVTPFFIGAQGFPDSDSLRTYINLDWINVSETYPRNTRKGGTFINRFISFDDKEKKITEIEFDDN